MTAALTPLHQAIIDRLAVGDLTTADLADLGAQGTVSKSLAKLDREGLARVTGTVPPAGNRGGRPRDVWSLTGAGRALFAEVPS